MKLSKRINDTVFYIVIGTVFSFALTGALLGSTYIKVTDIALLTTAFLASLFFGLWFFNKKTFLITLGALAATAIIVFLFLHVNDYDVGWFKSLSNLLYKTYLHVLGRNWYREEYAILGHFIAWGISLVAVGLSRFSGGFYLLSLAGFGALGALAYLQYETPKKYVVCFMFVFLCLFARRLNFSATKKGGLTDRSSTASTLLMPLALGVLFIATVIPAPKSAASGKDIIANMQTNIQLLDDLAYSVFSPKYFVFSTTGYSGADGRLGGDVRRNTRSVMRVYLSNTKDLPYLAGGYKDTYLGDRWTSSEDVSHKMEDIHTNYLTDREKALYSGGLDTLYSVVYDTPSPRTGRAASNLVSKADYQYAVILPLRTTRAAFAPASSFAVSYYGSLLPYSYTTGGISRFANRVSSVEQEPMHYTSLGTITFDRAINKESLYKVYYLPQTKAFLPSPAVTNSEILDNYLTLPENLPQRVYDLAEEITKDATTTHSKLKAIEDFLSKYPYTLTPGPVPNGVDFVDYFLFEGKTGYCTYYATAMAVMARCVGIPTRYAEGFMLPQTTESDGAFYVTNGEAHAWVDAFIFPYGWTTFEPTAPFTFPYYNEGANPERLERPITYNPGYEDDIEDLLEEVDPKRPMTTTAPPVTEAPSGVGEAEGGINGGFILLVLVTGFAAFVAIKVYSYNKKQAKLLTLSNKEAVIEYFSRILGLSSFRGMPIASGETALAFSRRVDSGTEFGVPGVAMTGIAMIFGKAKYGNEDILDSEKNTLQMYYSDLLAECQKGGYYAKAVEIYNRVILGKY